MNMHEDNAETYNLKYRDPNHFHYSELIYGPYISSLIKFCGLTPGLRVLDIGCGQGFFSYLFSKYGMKVSGIDLSKSGISSAKNMYGHLGINFSVADIETTTFPDQFDCVFVRSCSLYNNEGFPGNDEVTSKLLRYLRPSGIFIFVYNSNFSSKNSQAWRYHSWNDLKRHFRKYQKAEFYFSIKIDTWLLRKYAFSWPITRLNILISQTMGIGGDLICVLKKEETVF
jgi:SAM-dependent methyltransferase